MYENNLIDTCKQFYNKCYSIVTDDDIQRPAIWPVIVMAIIIFIVVGEIGSQSCKNGQCNHYNNVDKISSDDLTSKHIDSLISRIKLNHTTVTWRRVLLLSMILSLSILTIFYPGLPDGFDFFLVSAICFLVLYFSVAWFQYHWWRPKDYEQEEYLYNLRNQVKEMELNNAGIKRNMKFGNSGYQSITNKISSILSS